LYGKNITDNLRKGVRLSYIVDISAHHFYNTNILSLLLLFGIFVSQTNQ